MNENLRKGVMAFCATLTGIILMITLGVIFSELAPHLFSTPLGDLAEKTWLVGSWIAAGLYITHKIGRFVIGYF